MDQTIVSVVVAAGHGVAALVLVVGALYVAMRARKVAPALLGVSAGMVLWALGFVLGGVMMAVQAQLPWEWQAVSVPLMSAADTLSAALGGVAVLGGLAVALVRLSPQVEEPS